MAHLPVEERGGCRLAAREESRSAVSFTERQGLCVQIRLESCMVLLKHRICAVLLFFVALSCDAKADFPNVYNSEKDAAAAPPTPQESLAKLELPPGFRATVF